MQIENTSCRNLTAKFQVRQKLNERRRQKHKKREATSGAKTKLILKKIIS